MGVSRLRAGMPRAQLTLLTAASVMLLGLFSRLTSPAYAQSPAASPTTVVGRTLAGRTVADPVAEQWPMLQERLERLAVQEQLTASERLWLEELLGSEPGDRRRLVLPAVQSQRGQLRLSSVAPPGELAEVLADASRLWHSQSQWCVESGDLSAALISLHRSWAISPSVSPAASQFALWSTALTERQWVPRVPQPHPITGWPAGSYWSIRTPNFQISGQGRPSSAQSMALLCEQVAIVWRQLFPSAWIAPEQLERLLRAGQPLPRLDALRQPMQVVVFANRQQYVQQLRSWEPNIEESVGMYQPQRRCAFFYQESDRDPSTPQHELTHQLFAEASRWDQAPDLMQVPGIWAIEAVAMYLESLESQTRWGMQLFQVGGWDAPRLQAARYRALRNAEWSPWSGFASGTGSELKQLTDKPPWYSLAAGWGHFFLDGPIQRRGAFDRYLQRVYAGRGGDGGELLAELGLSNESDLRTAYIQFLNPPVDLIATRHGGWSRSQIVLSRLQIPGEVFSRWPLEARGLQWLDLSYNRLLDDSLWGADGVQGWDIERLGIEATAVGDASLPAVASMASLRELDLSECPVSDVGLEALRGHRRLERLWLTGTEVSDASLEVLLSLPRLQFLELSETGFTASGLERLKRARPRLKGLQSP